MFFQTSLRNRLWHTSAAVFGMTLFASMTVFAQGYVQTNLVADIPGLAKTADSLTVNAWGIARSGSGPWWISDNGTGVSTVYNGDGVAIENPPGTPFVVNIPNAPSGTGTAIHVNANYVTISDVDIEYTGASSSAADIAIHAQSASSLTLERVRIHRAYSGIVLDTVNPGEWWAPATEVFHLD